MAVGPADQVNIPSAVEVIDTRGMTMLPGLIDLHVHTIVLGHGECSDWFPSLHAEERGDDGDCRQAAISASTKTGAEIIGRGNDLGTIEPGKIADVIVVRGNPLFDINVLGYVEQVVKGGVVYR